VELVRNAGVLMHPFTGLQQSRRVQPKYMKNRYRAVRLGNRKGIFIKNKTGKALVRYETALKDPA